MVADIAAGQYIRPGQLRWQGFGTPQPSPINVCGLTVLRRLGGTAITPRLCRTRRRTSRPPIIGVQYDISEPSSTRAIPASTRATRPDLACPGAPAGRHRGGGRADRGADRPGPYRGRGGAGRPGAWRVGGRWAATAARSGRRRWSWRPTRTAVDARRVSTRRGRTRRSPTPATAAG